MLTRRHAAKDRRRSCRCQCLGPLSRSTTTNIGCNRGTWATCLLSRLQRGQGMPAPKEQASARLLSPFIGRSPWSSHTQPVSSHRSHAIHGQRSQRLIDPSIVPASRVRRARNVLQYLPRHVRRLGDVHGQKECLVAQQPPQSSAFVSSVDGSRVARERLTQWHWSGAVFCPAC
jgi:hypothetical protein